MTATEVAAYIAFVGYTAGEVAIGETIQIAESIFDYPWALKYTTIVPQIAALLIIPLWKYYRSYFKLSKNIIRKEKEYNAYAWFLYYSVIACIINAIDGILVYVSLQGSVITVPTSNAISGMKPVPVLILSALYLKQKLTLWCIMAMIMALIGILFFVFELNHTQHNTETHDTYFGIILTIAWTVGGAVCVIVNKQCANYCFEKDKIVIGSMLYTGVRAVAESILCPWFLIWPKPVDWTSITIDSWNWMIVNSSISLLIHFCEFPVIAWKSPFWLIIGTNLGIPISFLVDVWVHDYVFNVYAIVGTIFIISSFMMLEVVRPSQFHKLCALLMCCEMVLMNKDVDGTDAKIHGYLNGSGNDSIYKQTNAVLNELSQDLIVIDKNDKIQIQ